MTRARLVAVVLLPLLVACGEDTAVTTGGVDAGGDAATDGVGGVDTPGTPDAAVDAAPDSTSPTDILLDSAGGDADASTGFDAVSVDCDQNPGAFTCPCTENDDCESGYCLDSVTGRVCTMTCVEDCPGGWMCQSVNQPPDIVYLCTPRADFLCEPCSDDKACAGAKDFCIAQGSSGSFCGISCDSNADCPAWYSCEDATGTSGVTTRQCVPDTGSCICTPELLDTTRPCSDSNAHGVCYGEETCDGADGWTACDAAVPAAESCNGEDDDCDGQIDEDQSEQPCTAKNEHGTCNGTAACKGIAGLVCDATVPGPETCNGIDDNCDGLTDEPFAGVGGPCDGPDEDQCASGVFECTSDGKALTCVDDIASVDVCDGKDNDCDGEVDEDYTDKGKPCDGPDDDSCASGKLVCAPGKLSVVCDGDTLKVEQCNGSDDDCDGRIDEGSVDTDGDGTADCVDVDDDNDKDPDATDCAPLDAGVFSGAPELCNGKDDDCDSVADEGFLDTDLDALSDCTDPDDDNDNVPDPNDNCPLKANPLQTDTDSDGQGDACDLDDDGDTIVDATDNCPLVPNPAQTDTDDDKQGDECDADDDADGDPDTADCQPLNLAVHHGATEVCNAIDDNCNGLTDEGSVDTDKDGLADCADPDDDNDGDPDETDCAPTTATVFTDAFELCNAIDDDCDGLIDDGYLDTDGDGDADCVDEDADGDGDPDTTDCAPDDASIFHNAPEQCDGADNDCDGLSDEGFPDADLDGLANCVDGDDDNDLIPDAADNCAAVANPGQEDLDADGEGDVCDTDLDGDGDPNTTDCAPANGAVHHGAVEACNGKDDNCDAVVDEADAVGCATTYYDNDNDGYGNGANSKCLCGPSGKFSASTGNDCNDANAQVFPGATELCNGSDDDCDGTVDEAGATGCGPLYSDADGDGFGTGGSQCLCGPTGVFTATVAGDCAEGNADAHPGAPELCNDADDDCDGDVDEQGSAGCTVYYLDADEDGYGLSGDFRCLCGPSGGHDTTVDGDCDDGASAVNPEATEACNGADDDCDGATDEQDAAGCTTWWLDADGDGWGASGATQCLCAAQGDYVASVEGDCDDADGAVSPVAAESCNDKDDDCDGVVDEASAAGCVLAYADADQDGFGDAGDSLCLCGHEGIYTADTAGDCADDDASSYPGAEELCDLLDNDCDSAVDETCGTARVVESFSAVTVMGDVGGNRIYGSLGSQEPAGRLLPGDGKGICFGIFCLLSEVK